MYYCNVLEHLHTTRRTLISDDIIIYIHKVLLLNIVDLLVEWDKRQKHSDRLRIAWATGKYNGQDMVKNWKGIRPVKGPMPEAVRMLVSAGRKGWVMPDATRKKLSAVKKGEIHLPHKPETIEKIRASHIGLNTKENNPNWKGGISYQPYCFRFNKRRKYQTRQFFQFCCLACGMHESENVIPWKNGYKQVALSVHHIHHNKDEGCNGVPFNLVPLCHLCHEFESWKSEEYQKYINRVLESGFEWGIWSREQYEIDVMYPE